MESEQGQKSTRKSEEGVRKRLTKGEVLQSRTSPAGDYTPSCQGDPLPQQHFPSSLKLTREGPPRRVGRPCKPKGPLQEPLHISKPQPTSPAFMAPRVTSESGLDGPAWQVVDPIQPGPSRSFSSSALHARLSRPAEDSTQKAYVYRPTQVSVKQTEEPHKKEKKPQKPGKYICQYCSRPCAKPSVLQKHIRSHTGERPYPCIPCGFSFKTKSNLYKHRKSHAHRIKAGLATEIGAETYPSSLEMEHIGGEELEDPTEGESTDSEDETSTMSHLVEVSPQQKHGLLSCSDQVAGSRQVTSHDILSLSQPNVSVKSEEGLSFADPLLDLIQKSEDTHTIKQKLALRLSERKKASEEQTFLSPGSKGSTESGYFSRSESAEQQISSPNTNAKSYAEIILGKCGRIGQRTSLLATPAPLQEEKTSIVPLSVPRTQVIEHITKLITINEAVVDTSEIDSVKPRRSSLSRRSSIESPKASLTREPFQFDVKSSGSIPPLDAKTTVDKTKGEHLFLSHQQSHSATETVPLLRSHSMPSSACTISSPQPFRASYSFDERIVDSEVLSHSHVLSSHPRLLKRQPAIELPLGMEYASEEGGLTVKETSCKTSDHLEAKESDVSKKSRKFGRKGLIYECNICGACYKKKGNYETHKKYYCSDLQILKPQAAVPYSSADTGKGHLEHETWPQMPHYTQGPSQELSTLRKRRKEKSLGDEEDSQSFDQPEYPLSVTASGSHFSTPDAPLNLAIDTLKHSADLNPLPDIYSRTQGLEVKERTTISKEISVIQHTSSFEKSESMEQLGSYEEEVKTAAKAASHTVKTQQHSSHSLQPKLVRQHNIQVPEILVTEEPDKPEAEFEPPPKEQEKIEEFQWPQRSQTLAQLPAEKLPPKKKRLRLAEMAQSSGESSFESVSLTRSPSQESSISHTSSHSVSLDREEGFKADVPGQISESSVKSPGHHMLTVPSHLHHGREMRRSASEQAPNVSHLSQISENRSKSFDYGSLSSPASTSNPTAQERRKCFSVRQASLSRRLELEPDLTPRDWKETEQTASQISVKGFPAQFPVSCHGERLSSSPQSKQNPVTEKLEKTSLPHQLSPFPVQPLLHLPERSSETLESQAMTDVLSGPLSLSHMTSSVFRTSPLPLQHTHIHPELQLPQDLSPDTVDVPLRHRSPFIQLPCSGAPLFPPTFCLPVHSQFPYSEPAQIVGHYPQMLAPPVGTSSLSTKDGLSESLQPLSQSSSASESSHAVPVCSDPVVSLVVPVRIQTYMPLYGSAMYTTLSQIIVTHPECITSSVVHKSKGYPIFDFQHILPEDRSSLCHLPFLQVPFPNVELSSYIPLSAESELGYDGSSSVGGSKRMLSPAGSLELTMETQQQKRVKEEEVKDDFFHEETSKATKVLEDERTSAVASQVTMKPCTIDLLTTSPTATTDQPQVKEITKSALAPSVAGVSTLKLPGELKKCISSMTVKTEDSSDIFESSASSTPPVSRIPVNLSVSGHSQGTETKVLFPTLHTTTNVSWCYLKYVKPNHTQQSNRRASVYASWCISLYNPNLPGVSTRTALSLLRSKQTASTEIYTTADAPHLDTGRLVPSRARKPKMTEAHLPPQVHKETPRREKEDEKRGRSEEAGTATRRSEPSRIRIFEGGYKSNEEYVYVRGRGRGKYVCEECGIRCKKPSMLKKHIRTHTDLRPYVCKHCNFAFKTKGNLTKHMKSKAHSKKCQELGLVPPSLAELETEEGTSDDRWQDSDVVEEHQFSDLEDTDEEDSDEEEDEEEDEDESQEEKQRDLSPTVGTTHSPNQDPESAATSPAYRFSPNLLFATDPPEKDFQTLLGSEQTVPRETLSHRQWSPGKDISSRAGPSRRHLLQKKETPLRCFSPKGVSSPRRGMSPCQRLQSARELSPLRCVSPQHLSPHRDLSPHSYMSPDRGASSPVRHMSPSREMMSVRYAALRSGLATPPRYHSPGREEQHLSRLDSQTQLKVQHGLFPSVVLPHRTPEIAEQLKPGSSSSFLAMLRPLRSPHVPHTTTRSGENLFTHLPLHSQDLQRTPYPMIPIGGIQMVQARPSPQPSLLGPLLSEVKQEGPEVVQSHTRQQEGREEQLRTNRKGEEKGEKEISPLSTAPQRSPTSTYCQTACTPHLETSHASSGHHQGETEGDG